MFSNERLKKQGCTIRQIGTLQSLFQLKSSICEFKIAFLRRIVIETCLLFITVQNDTNKHPESWNWFNTPFYYFSGIEPCAVGSTVEVLINPHHAAKPELLEVKHRLHRRFKRAFTAWVCVFKVITLVWVNQSNYFENASVCSKRTLKTPV